MPPGAVNVVKGMCEGGQHIPSFGLPWDTHKSTWWCANFPVKPDITVNVVIKDCEHGKSNACFTMPAKGSGSARVDVVKGMCECGQHIPSFRLPWDTHKSTWWCANFPVKPDITVNVVIKDCEHGKSNGCFTMPAKGSGSARGCAN
eukprot:jgi/Tetstr1/427997/TSEL_018070.t1